MFDKAIGQAYFGYINGVGIGPAHYVDIYLKGMQYYVGPVLPKAVAYHPFFGRKGTQFAVIISQ
jgi:hypothetical protein